MLRLALCLALVAGTAAFTIHKPESQAGSPKFGPCAWFGPDWEVTGNATVAAPFDLCDGPNFRCGEPPHFPVIGAHGHIGCAPRRADDAPKSCAALVDELGSGCSYETKTRLAKEAGCRALVVKVTSAEPGGSVTGPYQFSGASTGNIEDMVLVTVQKDDFGPLRNAAARGEQVLLTAYRNQTALDSNSWYRVWESTELLFFCNICLPLLQAYVLAIAVYKLVIFSRLPTSRRQSMSARKQQTSLPVLVLRLEVLANAVRLFYVCVDPVWSTHVLPRFPSQVLTTFSLPFAMITTALIAYFWCALRPPSPTTPVPPPPPSPSAHTPPTPTLSQASLAPDAISHVQPAVQAAAHLLHRPLCPAPRLRVCGLHPARALLQQRLLPGN